MKLFKEKAGVISPYPIWVFFHKEFMYEHKNLFGLLWKVITQWNNPRNMVG